MDMHLENPQTQMPVCGATTGMGAQTKYGFEYLWITCPKCKASPEYKLLELQDRQDVVIVGYRRGGTAIEVTCGSTFGGYRVLCEEHEAEAHRDYPQGWRYYPGDTCRHGVYVGGCGADYMCGACEAGEPDEAEAAEESTAKEQGMTDAELSQFLYDHCWEGWGKMQHEPWVSEGVRLEATANLYRAASRIHIGESFSCEAL